MEPITIAALIAAADPYLRAALSGVAAAAADKVKEQGLALVAWLAERITGKLGDALRKVPVQPSPDQCEEVVRQLQKELERNAELVQQLDAYVREHHLVPAVSAQGDVKSVQIGNGNKSIQLGHGSSGNQASIG